VVADPADVDLLGYSRRAISTFDPGIFVIRRRPVIQVLHIEPPDQPRTATDGELITARPGAVYFKPIATASRAARSR